MADANVPVVQISKEPIPSDPEMIYTVTSEEGIEFRVSDKALRMSETMNAMLGATPEDVARNDAIPINNIKGDILELVFKWCEEHKGESIPVDDGSIPKNVTTTDFDEKLMDIDNDKLFNLICAANYLNVKGLLNVTCKKVALMAKGKSPEELRGIYGIPTDEEDEAAEKLAAKMKAEKAVADKKMKAIEATAAAQKTEEMKTSGGETQEEKKDE